MSRIGKQPIPVPPGVEVAVEPERVRVKGPKGELEERVSRDMKIEQEDGQLVVSRPGQRHYAPAGGVRKVQGGMGTSIVSTSRGVMTGHEARQAGVGGEVVAEVW